MKLGDRLDGHIVQGHVDQVASCTDIQNQNGSWNFTFGTTNDAVDICHYMLKYYIKTHEPCTQ